jgi:hypothetical protein
MPRKRFDTNFSDFKSETVHSRVSFNPPIQSPITISNNNINNNNTTYNRNNNYQANEISEDDIIDLSIGGMKFSTRRETLCTPVPLVDPTTGDIIPDETDTHMLATMFSGDIELHMNNLHNKKYFIDRDGTYFRYILNYLRCIASGSIENLILPWDNKSVIQELIVEAMYYDLKHLVQVLQHESVQMECSLMNSSIVTQFEDIMRLKDWYGNRSRKWKLVYKGTRDGFTSSAFHTHCDHKGPTITIIESTNGCVFGGYASVSWNCMNTYIRDPKAFLFSLKNPSREKKKLSVLIPATALYGRVDCLAVFGAGPDICK